VAVAGVGGWLLSSGRGRGAGGGGAQETGVKRIADFENKTGDAVRRV
jgi:hypothetical protein